MSRPKVSEPTTIELDRDSRPSVFVDVAEVSPNAPFSLHDKVVIVAADDFDRLTRTLAEVLAQLQIARKRWCAEEVDDPEEMWIEIPEMLDDLVAKLEACQ